MHACLRLEEGCSKSATCVDLSLGGSLGEVIGAVVGRDVLQTTYFAHY